MKDEQNSKYEKKDFGEYISGHRNIIISFLCGVLVTGVVCGIIWPSNIAKLSDGSELVASTNSKNISANALYTELNSRGGLSTLLDMIDEDILLSKYSLKEEAEAYANEQSASTYEQWQSVYGLSKEDFLSNNGFETEDEYMHFLEIEFYKNKYSNDYMNSKITDEEIEKFYNDVVKEERRAYVFYSAEENKDLEKIRKSLAKGEKVEDLKDKYSSVTYRDLANVNFNNYNLYTENFLSKLNSLGKGEVSKVFQDDNFGYAVVYVSYVEDKAALDDIKDKIRTNLAQKLNESDPNIYYRAFQELRDEYEFKIEDANLKKEYDEFVEKTKEK